MLLASETSPPPYEAAGSSAADAAATAEEGFALIERGLEVLGAQVLGGAISDPALLDRVIRLERLARTVIAEKLRGVNELTTRSAATGLGARSTADLLAAQLGLNPGEAKRQTQTAEVLEQLPQTAERLRNGDIGVGQAETAAQVYVEMGVADEQTTAEYDAYVADKAGKGNRRQLRDHLDGFVHDHAPDRLADRDRRAHARRSLRRWIDEANGTWHCQGSLPLAAGALVDAAINGIIARDQGPTADAGHPACAGGHDGEHGGGCGGGDGRTWEQKAADALVGLASQTIAEGELPTVHGEAARVLMIDTDTNSPAIIDGAGPVSDATADQVRCDAEIRYVRQTRNGANLDVGRALRDPTPKQRAAVIARDRTCIGCGAAAARCQIHHRKWWRRDHGPTDESNLVLACWNCHHHIHHHGWTITGNHITDFRINRTGNGSDALPTAGTGRRR